MTIRLTDHPPIHCAGCFNAQPQLRHVDFDSALDRGYGNEEAVKVSMDEAIFCENCVKEAAEQIGMTNSDDLKAENADLKRKLDIKEKRLRQVERYSDTMEEALTKRPTPVQIDHRKRPRKELIDA